MRVVKLLPRGLPRVLNGAPGMTFIVDHYTYSSEFEVGHDMPSYSEMVRPIAHVRDYRFLQTDGRPQIWSIGPDGYEPIPA